MAIRFRHDAAGIGGNGAGGDSRRKFGQALVLQQQRFAQDNAQRAQDRMFDLGRMRLADQFQFARDQRMIQADRDLLAARQEAENRQFAERRKLQQEDMDAAIQRGMVQDSTRFVEGRVADVRGMLAKQQYTPEGQKIYGDLFGALRSIEAQRDTIRPKEYNALLNKWLDNAERSGLEKFVAQPPTIDEELGGRFKDLGTGYGVFMQPDGKVEVREIDPAKIEGAKGNASSMSAAEYFANDSNYEAAKKKALQSMQEKYLADNPNATAAPSFSAEKIHDQMLKDFNEHQKFLQQLGGSNQAGSQPVAPNDTVSSPSPTQPERPKIVFEETGSPRMPTAAAQPPTPQAEAVFGETGSPRMPTAAAQPLTPQAEAIQSNPGIGQGFKDRLNQGREQAQGMLEPATGPEAMMQILGDRMQKDEKFSQDAAQLTQWLADQKSNEPWTAMIKPEAIQKAMQAGSQDPVGDAMRFAKQMTKVSGGYKVSNAPTQEEQDQIRKYHQTIHTLAEYEALPPGTVFIDGTTDRIMQKVATPRKDKPAPQPSQRTLGMPELGETTW